MTWSNARRTEEEEAGLSSGRNKSPGCKYLNRKKEVGKLEEPIVLQGEREEEKY